MGGRAETYREKGNDAYRLEQWDEAIRWYTLAISETDDDLRPLGNRSACYAKIGKYAEALGDANRGLERRPRWAKGWSRKGLAHFYLNQYEEAKKAYLAGLELKPSDTTALKAGLREVEAVLASGGTERERGNAAFKAADYARAVRHYTSALQEVRRGSEDEAAVMSNRSAAYAKLKQGREALVDANRAVALRPEWGKAYSRKAVAHYLLKEFEEARAAYCTGLSHDPDNAELTEGLKHCSVGAEGASSKEQADAAFKEGRFEDAARGYGEAIAASPDDAKLYSNRSASYAKLCRWAEALTDAKKTLALNPSWARAWSRTGAALHGSRDLESAYAYYCKGLLKCPGASELMQARQGVLEELCKWDTRLANWRENQWYAKDAQMPRERMRVYVTSDLHVDQHGNIAWCKGLSSSAYQHDVLIVAGDCGDTMNAIKQGMRELKTKFRRVFFTPGNHDLWIRPGLEDQEYPDSVCKLLAMLNVFDEIGVEMAPAEVAQGLYVVPLYSWYNAAFDEGDPVPGSLRYDKFCKWPMPDTDVWQYMLNLNRERVRQYKRHPEETVLTCSHFLPRHELPFPWGVAEMAKNVGCKELDLQVQRVEADMHVYGHTHMNGDGECGNQYVRDSSGALSATGAKNNVRYCQMALEGGERGLYCVWDKGVLMGVRHDAV
ncbi:hypothetical protein CYMTET_11335 [Cymbomonas tetramitiformis]|uniref:Calcineurin-like phosphoesterase domain-containing protein n=1 Tax=Cymbomonas tetramitiformis TaxID=36881 RepID=A0AAE0GNW9_9CHLO|nr:hypothetical protein CYMTET_11335 [Cymbomonas tetramitiformis]